MITKTDCVEWQRLAEAESRKKYWRRWGPYLAERAWGVVREDYSANGDPWSYFPHDHARSRAYRWTEDGLLGISDNHQYLCFALTVWNGKDPILKERLFGLSGQEGNHGEDVKEIYYYLDATPTASYLKGLYKYPQAEFPYARMLEESRRRTRMDPEFDLYETGIFDDNRYFDVFAEYAKAGENDIVIRVTVANRGPEPAELVLLPTLWFRNTWTWGAQEDPFSRPSLRLESAGEIRTEHMTMGRYRWELEPGGEPIFTENDTNQQVIWNRPNPSPYVKDAFDRYLIKGEKEAVNPERKGTKAAVVYRLSLGAGEERVLCFRLSREDADPLPREGWPALFDGRIAEADDFYQSLSVNLDEAERKVQRQAFAGLFWSKQFYHYVVQTWLDGDPYTVPPPESRKHGRNSKWVHLFNADIISMPDKWEYPWYAAWDLAFHAVAIAPADPDFAKTQLLLFLREWYMHPNGQLPAYEWSFSDVNPPVHAWGCWRVFQIDRRIKGKGDYGFLERAFHKLLVNFTWWVNRKDSEGANVFEGGFLGLDNIGLFDRSAELPSGWLLEQSDGTSWMAMFSLMMLKMALQLSSVNPVYEDIASKFFEHFLYIADAINHHYGSGLWDEEDGFYYDRLNFGDGKRQLLRIRSLVGLVPLFAVETLELDQLKQLPGFEKRMSWFIENRKDLTAGLAPIEQGGMAQRRLLSLVNRERLERILKYVLSESEFLSKHGVRSLSRYHKDHPYALPIEGREFRIDYEPAESQTGMFGGNSNWRGPVWFPMNFLLLESLQRLHFYYGDGLKVEFPTGSGTFLNLADVARELSKRLVTLFLPDAEGKRPAYGNAKLFQENPHFREYALFNEYFDGDTGVGLGASHQTGWTGLVAKLLQQIGGTGLSSSLTNS